MRMSLTACMYAQVTPASGTHASCHIPLATMYAFARHYLALCSIYIHIFTNYISHTHIYIYLGNCPNYAFMLTACSCLHVRMHSGADTLKIRGTLYTRQV